MVQQVSFFGTISGNMWELPQNFQPFAVRFTNAFTHVTSMKNLYSSDPADFPNPTNPASKIGVSPFPYVYSQSNPRYVAPSALTFLQQGFRWPSNYQINFGVQQQFTKDLALSINYVGVLNRKLPFIIDENAPIFNTAAPANNTTSNFNCRRPYWLSHWRRHRLPRHPCCWTELHGRRVGHSKRSEP